MRPFNTVTDVTHRAVDALNLINELAGALESVLFITPADMIELEGGPPSRIVEQFKKETGQGSPDHPVVSLNEWAIARCSDGRAVLAKAYGAGRGEGSNAPMSHADLTVMVTALANTLETAKFDINKELSDCDNYEMRKRLERLDMTITPVLKHFRRL